MNNCDVCGGKGSYIVRDFVYSKKVICECLTKKKEVVEDVIESEKKRGRPKKVVECAINKEGE